MQDDILKLAYELSKVTEEKIDSIDGVMRKSELLAINARVEAARAGASGAAFSVVAHEMGQLAETIRRLSTELRDAIIRNTEGLEMAGAKMLHEFRGTRYADLALNAIELIDRNLYERSCDVRWWATDQAVVDAAATSSEAANRHAGERLATILRSYTVYLDLWIADADGKVIATGRPQHYPKAAGADVSNTLWFREAIATRTGDDFAVTDVESNPLLSGSAVATYATAIREGGEADGKVIGALGIFFDWAPQAAAIVEGVSLSPEERAQCRVLLLDANHRVIAASDGQGILKETYKLAATGRGHLRDGDRVIGYALTPGYETYAGLGWYGVVEGVLGVIATSEAKAA